MTKPFCIVITRTLTSAPNTKMKLFLALIALAFLTACQHPYWTPKERAAIGAAIDAAPPNPGKTEPPGRPLITTETKFASRCPYDGTLAASQSTSPSGGSTIGGTNYQHWSIAYTCARCGMMFTDTRNQILPDTKSIRVPLASHD